MTTNREYEYSLRIAREIQFRLFPVGPPEVEGFDIGGATYPAAGVDGDYYDYIHLVDGSLAVTIGDACGHGLGAALLSARAHACLRTLSLTFDHPGDILRMANRVLASGMSPNRFITLMIARLDCDSRQLTYANAGHPSGFVIDKHNAIKATLESNGFPLGVDDDTPYPMGEPVDLKSGDIVLLLTDGVQEARAGPSACFGIERALDVVCACRDQTATQIVEALHDAVEDYCGSGRAIDDITAVVIKAQ